MFVWDRLLQMLHHYDCVFFGENENCDAEMIIPPNQESQCNCNIWIDSQCGLFYDHILQLQCSGSIRLGLLPLFTWLCLQQNVKCVFGSVLLIQCLQAVWMNLALPVILPVILDISRVMSAHITMTFNLSGGRRRVSMWSGCIWSLCFPFLNC